MDELIQSSQQASEAAVIISLPILLQRTQRLKKISVLSKITQLVSDGS